VGGVVENLGNNASAGKGNEFVIEADEYDHMFLGLEPDLALITNVEHDHPDIFPTTESFEEAFHLFVGKLKPGGTLILCAEDPGAQKMVSNLKKDQKLVRYGFEGNGIEYVVGDITFSPERGSQFELSIPDSGDRKKVQISLQLPGEHNVLNAAAAFAAADQIGLDRIRTIGAIGDFKGSKRRFEIRGEFGGICLIDDYAHHPTEIKTTLKAARAVFPGRRIVGVWQPHTFSRTQTLFSDFTKAFADADEIIVLDVYAAREKKPAGFSLSDLVKKIDGVNAIQISGKSQVVDYLKGKLSSGDVLLIFSAGDAIEINIALEDYYSDQANK
jgi:UDP-N-acetylmuramate--alanine ligase